MASASLPRPPAPCTTMRKNGRRPSSKQLPSAALDTFRHSSTRSGSAFGRTMHPLSTSAKTALSVVALNAVRRGSRNSDSRCSIAPAPRRKMSTACHARPSRSIRQNPHSFSTNFPAARSSMPALPHHPCPSRSCGVTLYAPRTRKKQRRPTGTPVFCATASNLCLAAQGDPSDAALASTDDDADVAVYLTDTEDEAPQPPATPRTPNTAQQFVHGGRNIPLPPAVDHSSVHQAQQQDPECQEFRRLFGLPRSEWPPHLQSTPLRFCLVHDLLCVSMADATRRVVLPAIFRRRAIHAHHISYYGCRLGITETAACLASPYWWSRLPHDFRAYSRTCTFCLAHAGFPKKWR
ncbi:hypothetical protein ACSSS7_004962 [Eimeria intestinalis]